MVACNYRPVWLCVLSCCHHASQHAAAGSSRRRTRDTAPTCDRLASRPRKTAPHCATATGLQEHYRTTIVDECSPRARCKDFLSLSSQHCFVSNFFSGLWKFFTSLNLWGGVYFTPELWNGLIYPLNYPKPFKSPQDGFWRQFLL